MTRASLAAIAVAAMVGGAAAQTTAPQEQPAPPPASPLGEPNSASALGIPNELQLFGSAIPSVVKATAIINGDIVTQTDIDHRVALLVISQGSQVDPAELERLRQQVLRNLIDETLQIQAARAEEIQIKQSDVDKTIERVAGNLKQTPQQLAQYLTANGSSIRTMRRQIEGEIAWQRLLRAKVESGISVGDDEVNAVLEKMTASKGTAEYRVGEIFLSSNPATEVQTLENANRILGQLRNGASFAGYARQFSEASTAAVGGDLGWVRPEQLPPALAAAIPQLEPGMVSSPIPLPGGVSIIAIQDVRRILTPDPRDAVLSLKQISISFPKDTTRQQAEPIISRFAEAARTIGGCGGAERIGTEFQGEVVSNDQVKLRDLPPVLQQMMLPMQIGQATQPVGSIEDSVRVFVICGRDEVDPTQPSFDDVYNQISEERTNVRARRYLRDLRRDAIIEFR
ncbi:MAG: peptidylprolyl isomerase [Sphingomicrobium sp.]